jgi:hypothetical protein
MLTTVSSHVPPSAVARAAHMPGTFVVRFGTTHDKDVSLPCAQI